MAPVALNGGAYSARSIIAGAQRCVNLFAEKNPEGAPVQFTYYPTPGLVLLAAPPTAGAGRGLYRASNGVVYVVVGRYLYALSSAWRWTLLGSLNANLTTPVTIADNGTDMLIADGTGDGYLVTLLTLSLIHI